MSNDDKFWRPIIAGSLLTLFLFFSMQASPLGEELVIEKIAKRLWVVPHAISLTTHSDVFAILVALFQYPLYGLALGWVWSGHKLHLGYRRSFQLVLLIHIGVASVVLIRDLVIIVFGKEHILFPF